jgi:hypothetical protein
MEKPATTPKPKFSFTAEYNKMKGIGIAGSKFDKDPYAQNPKMKKLLSDFEIWAQENGVYHDRVEYPVSFGEGSTAYVGTLAVEPIPKDTVIVKTPGKIVITAYNGYSHPVLSDIIYDHPEVFSKELTDGEDFIITMFLMLELQYGDNSFWHPWFAMWPREKDMLCKWSDEELEEL